MKKLTFSLIPTTLLALAVFSSLCPTSPRAVAAEGGKTKDEETIASVMKLCNKALKGTPKLAEKVADGSASDEETKKVVDSYKTLKGAKPPKGEAATWDKRIDALDKKEAGAAAKFKEANACKACHTDHKPEQH